MITIREAKEISLKTELTDLQMLEVIQKYIYDTKRVIININRPTDAINIQLMNIAFETAVNYYRDEI